MDKKQAHNPLQGELKTLLDGYTYIKAADGKEYTPRSGFEYTYDQIITDPEGYFAELEEMIDKETAGNERAIYIDAGGGHDGAIALIEVSLNILADGTVEPVDIGEE